MRKLIVLRGAPGAGKSTWVRENNLEQFTLCPDDIRLMCSTPKMGIDDKLAIVREPEVESIVWSTLLNLLEYRMSRGEFTVIDATASKTKDIQQYKILAAKYRYKVYCVDFSGIPLETCIIQNKLRAPFKQVPEEAIKAIYARFKNQPVPGGIATIKPDELSIVFNEKLDLSKYKKIVFIGDIHGCFNTLMQYSDFNTRLNPETAYIFLGDYIDRGTQNFEVLNWLTSIVDFPNVCLLEGNHERHLRAYGEGIEATSQEFTQNTLPQLIKNGFTSKQAKKLYSRLRQISYFTYGTAEILACHGGISYLPENLIKVSTKTFINGTGTHSESQAVAGKWLINTNKNQYLVHGHRNVDQSPVQVNDRVFNLEGQVEFGGNLRIAELTLDNLNNPVWHTIELTDCQPLTMGQNTELRKILNVSDAILYLRNNNYVKEKELTPDISSFNFTNNAFFKSNWTEQTILARGLFLDTTNNKIIARSYEKFFRIDERPETTLESLNKTLKFPIQVFLKENGFLALVSYDYINDSLFIASKSTNSGKYVNLIAHALGKRKKDLYNYLKDSYLKNDPVTFVFECENPVEDPHIIEYKETRLVLLDIIENKLTFKTKDFEQLSIIGNTLGFDTKRLIKVFTNFEELEEFYKDTQKYSYQLEGNYIEGFVLRDSSNFMTKCKTGYYNTWKKLRNVLEQVAKYGIFHNPNLLQTSLEQKFYDYCCLNKGEKLSRDLISVRRDFLDLHGGN